MDIRRKIPNKVKPPFPFLAIVLLQRELCSLTMIPCWAGGQSMLSHVWLQLESDFKHPMPLLLCRFLLDGTCLWARIGCGESTCLAKKPKTLDMKIQSPAECSSCGMTSVCPWVNCSVTWYPSTHFLQSGAQLHFLRVLQRKIYQRQGVVQLLPEPCNDTSPPCVP